MLIKSLVATVSFTVEPQKPMGGIVMLPDFLAVRGASTASQYLLHDAKDVWKLFPTSNFSTPPANFGKQLLPPLAGTCTPIPETKLLHNFLTLNSHRLCCHFFSFVTVTALLGT